MVFLDNYAFLTLFFYMAVGSLYRYSVAMIGGRISYKGFVSRVVAGIVRNHPFSTIHQIRAKLSGLLGEECLEFDRLGLGSFRRQLLLIAGMSI
ncbi:hypothetical protein ABEB36_008360 [Hypothenemus hampei]|uniref:Uncharacterized protein n=1 Tax=Hypothenemus hampei TaxID=57062 RepID=A0ABD1EM52_HYPHA